MSKKPIEFYCPNKDEWNKLKGVMIVTMKVLPHSNKIKAIRKAFTDLSSSLNLEDVSAGDIIDSATEVGKKILEKVKNSGTTTAKEIMTLDNYMKDSIPILELRTYIPASFGIELAPIWSESDMITTESVMKQGNELLFGKLGGAMNNVYEKLKAQGEAVSKTSINPKKLKVFRPSFVDKPFKISLTPQNKEEARDFKFMLSMIREGCIPKNIFNAEWFEFPAIFDIDIFITNSDSEIISTDDDSTSFYRHFKNMGMTQFVPVPKSGSSLDSPTKRGEYIGWDVDLAFTSLNRVYENTSVEERVNKLISKMG